VPFVSDAIHCSGLRRTPDCSASAVLDLPNCSSSRIAWRLNSLVKCRRVAMDHLDLDLLSPNSVSTKSRLPQLRNRDLARSDPMSEPPERHSVIDFAALRIMWLRQQNRDIAWLDP